MENTFANAAKEAARIMERSALRTYRITYTNGKFLTLWNGESPEHALALCASTITSLASGL